MHTTLDNHDTGAIVDELGALKADIAELEAREKALRDELVRRKITVAEGALFRATVATAVQWRLDNAAIKSAMDDRWVRQHSRQSLVTTVAVKARIGKAA